MFFFNCRNFKENAYKKRNTKSEVEVFTSDVSI